MFTVRRSTRSLMMLIMVAVLALSAMMTQPVAAADPPSVVSVTRVGTSSTSAAGSVDFTVTFSVPVQGVDTLDFALAGSIADASITNVAGAAGDTVYTVTVSTGTGDGTVGVDVLNDGSITDMGGPPQPLSAGFTGGDTYQMRNPFVQSITLLDTNPTSKANVRFQVTFSDAVVGVNTGTASDFALVTTGVAGAQIGALTGTGAVYTVTVQTALGNGTLKLNLADDDTIKGPNNGRVLGGAGAGNGNFTGPTYTVKKVPVPSVPAGTLYTTKPTFKWTTVPRATQYQIEVYKGLTRVYYLNVPVTYCTATLCTRTPTNVLLPAAYKWHVRAVIDGTWKPFSPYKTFTTVVGFNSQFNGNATGWIQRPGAAWSLTGGTTYWTNGIYNKTSSVSYNQTFANYTYQVRIKRLGVADGYGGEAGLIVRGVPTYNSYNDWKTGYYFIYSSYYRGFYIVKAVNGVFTTLKPGTLTSTIVQNGWNTLKVVANGTSLKFYINGVLVWSGLDSSLKSGQVGVYDWSGGSAAGRIDLDWATLSTLPPMYTFQAEETVEAGQVPLPLYIPLTNR